MNTFLSKNLIKQIFVSVIFVLASSYGYPQDPTRRVAVIEFKNSAQLTSFELSALESMVRGSASRLGGYRVMTKENMRILLPPDKAPEDCLGTCEVEMGRLLGAAFIVTGEIGRVEGQLQLSLRLFETSQGSLLSQEIAMASDILTIQQQLNKTSAKLLSKLSVVSSDSTSVDDSLILLTLSPNQQIISLDGGPLYLKDLPKKGESYLVRLKPGQHILHGEASGYLSQDESFYLASDGVMEVRLELSRSLKKDESCAASDPECRADLLVVTQPAGAQLWIDGKKSNYITRPSRNDTKLGNITLSLSPGEHVIEARLARHLRERKRVILNKKDLNIDMRTSPIRLSPNFGDLVVHSNPSGAQVHLDDKLLGKTPLKLTKIDAGPHKLSLLLDDYRTEKTVTVIKRGEVNREVLELKPTFSKITIEVSAEGKPLANADILLDQLSVGLTDSNGLINLEKIPSGEKQIQVSHSLYKTEFKSFLTKAGVSSHVSIDLKPQYALLDVVIKDHHRATLNINGENYGFAPIKALKVPSGNHIIELIPKEAERYAPWRGKLSLSTLQSSSLQVKFKPRRGNMIILTEPSEVDVAINGKHYGQTPINLNLFKGLYLVSLSYPDYPSRQVKLRVKEDQVLRYQFSLSKFPATKISCSPSGMIYVNDREEGISPVVLYLPPEEHKISCINAGLNVHKLHTPDPKKTSTLKLKFLEQDLKNQAQFRVKQKWWAYSLGALSASLGYGALFFGLHKLPKTIEARNRAVNIFDHSEAWRIDEQAKDQQLIAIGSASLALGLSIWGLIEFIRIPPDEESRPF